VTGQTRCPAAATASAGEILANALRIRAASRASAEAAVSPAAPDDAAGETVVVAPKAARLS
jgi:hypothetical protein